MATRNAAGSKFAVAFGVVWLLVAGWAYAQGKAAGAQLTGVVVEAAGGAAVSGAEVALSPSARSARTDAKGRFVFDALPAGVQTARVSHAGFQPTAAKVTMPASGVVSVRLVLTRVAPQTAKLAEGAAKGVAKAESESRVRRSASKPSARMSYGYGAGMAMGSASVAPQASMGMGYRAVPAPPAAVPLPKDREGYDAIDEQSFLAVADQPLSTLSIDVDAAAYSNVRRFLTNGELPPKDAVRIEELVNYFSYDYPDPQGDAPFAVVTEVADAPWNPAHRLVRVGIQGRRVDAKNLPPANLVFLVDVSGSMSSEDKLPLLVKSLSMLTAQLRDQDRVSIVVYAGAAGVVLPPTPGSDKTAILSALARLQAGGSTAGAEGLQLAYETAQKAFLKGGANRVILCTDGDFNVGVSSDGELVRMIEEKRASGVYLTVLGFGQGNYQDAKMQKLADKGNGNHAYIDSALEAHKVLVGQMGGTLLTIAKDVKIQVEFNPVLVKGYRLLGYENRMLAARDFDDDKKDAGELGAGHSVTAFYEIVPANSAEPLKGADRLKYQAAAPTQAALQSGELMTVKLRYKPPTSDESKLLSQTVVDQGGKFQNASEDFRFAAAVAAWGLILRDSPFKGTATLRAVEETARASLGPDTHAWRHDFVGLVARSSDLSTAHDTAKVATP
jgi:Ca-activated chloride channel family protein